MNSKRRDMEDREDKGSFRILRHRMGTSLALVGIGMLMEVLVVGAFPVLRYLYDTDYFDYNAYWRLLCVNSLAALLGSLVLCYGVLSAVRALNAGRQPLIWICLATSCFIAYRILNVLQTHAGSFFRDMFNTSFNMDLLLLNTLLAMSSLLLVIGLMRALWDSNKTRALAEERNAALKREMRDREISEVNARASEERFETLLNALTSMVFLCDISGFVLTHNKAFAQFLGRADDRLIGMHLRDLLPQQALSDGRKKVMRVFEHKTHTSFMLALSGRTWEVNTYPVLDDNNDVLCIAVLARDITNALREEEERHLLETAMNNAAETILITDAEGTIVYVNVAFETTTGYSRMEALGKTPALLKSGRHDAQHYADLWKTLTNGEQWHGRFLNRRKNGELFHERAAISPVQNAQGETTHYIAVKRDITREHQLEKQLQQSQKIEAIGTLAGGIAHDLNNVLGIVLGRAELALDALGQDHAAYTHVDIITQTATRSSRLIKQLLSFSRKETSEVDTIQIGTLVKEHTKLLRTYLPANITIRQHISTDAGCVHADPGEIQQIIMNLCTNANHAMQPNGGMLIIGLEAVALSSELLVATGRVPAGDYVRLQVEDTGAGMTPEVRTCIFDPFFTTKDESLGTGLGLAMVQGAMERAGGAIDVHSAPGEGTRFDLYWPRTEYRTPQTPYRVKENLGAGYSVLVVDDLEDFKEFVSLALESNGFKVQAFSDPQEALAFYTENAETIDVAVVDYMMPGMNGAVLTERLHEVCNTLPVVLLSGYSTTVTEDNAPNHGFYTMLRKPVTTGQLVHTLVRAASDADNDAPSE